MSRRAGNKRCIGVCQGPIDHCCASCDFKTTSITGLRLHLKIKHEKKPTIKRKRDSREKCTVCGETFRGIEEVVKHVKRAHRQR